MSGINDLPPNIYNTPMTSGPLSTSNNQQGVLNQLNTLQATLQNDISSGASIDTIRDDVTALQNFLTNHSAAINQLIKSCSPGDQSAEQSLSTLTDSLTAFLNSPSPDSAQTISNNTLNFFDVISQQPT